MMPTLHGDAKPIDDPCRLGGSDNVYHLDDRCSSTVFSYASLRGAPFLLGLLVVGNAHPS
jgi:hypothetical protein